MHLETSGNNGASRANSDLFVDLTRDLLQCGCRVRFPATGSSMHPTIRNAERVTVAPVHAESIARGDVLLCSQRRGPTVHRVLAVRGGRNAPPVLRLRGDNAASSDGPVSADDVLGRVVTVTRDGAERRLRRGVAAHRLRWLASQLSPVPIRRLLRLAVASVDASASVV